MKIVLINSVSYGSTGSIMFNIHKFLLNSGIESYAIWGRGRKAENNNEVFLSNKIGVFFHKLFSMLTGRTGFASYRSTKKLLKILDKIQPNIIHLNNIHGYYLNIELLFNYIKKNNIKVVWTLHDCWSFTGHCAHFSHIGCNKWETKCFECPKYNEYPFSCVDNSAWNYTHKKNLFNGVNDLTIITPSDWLANLVKKSFLKDYTVKVINNGIDTSIFRKLPENELSFRKQNHLENKKIILGVAAQFGKKKGFDDFIKLSKILDDEYIIVLVGLTRKQISYLPNNVMGISRTSNVNELVDIYNSSDLFVNLTYEENYPTVNLEAIACGTPVLTYDTGGSAEFLKFLDGNTKKYIIEKEKVQNDFTVLKNRIYDIINDDFQFDHLSSIDCKTMVDHYIDIYKI